MPGKNRARYLEETFGEEEALRTRILELLEAYERASGFLESQPDSESRDAAERMRRIAPSDENEGDLIGRYRLVRRIGEGTHGSVWLADQTEDIKRRVALKILKLGMDTKDFLARFEVEKRILALLDHPCIAKVFDAGATDYGRLYFVMEYVGGKPLSEMADEAHLDIRDRIRIFIDVCRALQHAHSKGIIHRDLKPSNILAAKLDGKIVPKIIDFGIAKIASPEVSGEDMMETLERVFVGTPVYASPEQLDETGSQLDFRSDVYSLGAVLYEFLTGRAPFELGSGSTRSLDSLRSTIRTTEPQRPSKRIEDLPEKDRSELARLRSGSAEKIPGEIKGELDWVILKCLDKDPERRYQKAGELADDLDAWLQGEPVSAVAPSNVYRLRKFISRKRPAYAVWLEGSLAAVVLLAVYLSVKLENRPLDRTGDGGLSDLSGSLYRETQNSIAVLPFDNSSGLESDRSLVNGIHLDLLTQLSKISTIKTISARSVRGYRNTAKSSESIGEELGVSTLLTGEVENIGDRIQVSVYLENVSTGAYLWSESYERKLDTAADIFSIRNQIASAVAEQLETVLSPEELRSIERVPTQNLKALEAYFKGKEILATDLRARMQEAGEYFQEAIDLDPEFAQAYAGLADSILGRTGVWGGRLDPFLTVEESQELSIGLISKALELNPDLAEGHTLQGRFHREMEDYSRAEASYKRALEINPNYALAWNEYASLQTDKEAMFAMVRKSIELDPANAEFKPDLILQLCWFGRFEEALVEAEKLTRSNPDYPPGYWLAAAVWMDAFGRYDKGVEWLRRGAAVDPRDVWVNNYLVMAYEFLGDPDEAARWQELKMTLSKDPPDFLQQFDLHRLKGEYEEALKDCREYIAQGGDAFRAWRYALNADLRSGRFELAQARYKAVAPYLFDIEPILEVGGGRDFTARYQQPRLAMQLAAVLHGAGEVEQATKLLDRGWKLFKERPLMGSDGRFGYGIRDVIQFALKGEKRKALDAFREAVDAGYRDRWFLDCAELDPLRNDPEFVDLEKVITDELSRQLADVRQMEQRGDLAPYPKSFVAMFGIFEYDSSSLMDPESNFKPSRKSIAVLPFENLSGREEDEPFTNGIHSTLLTQVSRIRDLKPTSRTSVMAYTGTNKNLTQIAEELQVANVLNGDVQFIGQDMRVNVHLVEAATDTTLWGETYTRDYTAENFFSIQNEITKTIAESLKAIMTPQERDRLAQLPTRNTEALEIFIKGTNIFESAIQTRRQQSIDYLKQAIDLDPSFVPAYVNLGRAYLSEASVSVRDKEWWTEAFDNAEGAAATALQLDSDSAEAHALLGRIQLEKETRWEFEGDLDLAKRSIERALELNPNYAEAYEQRGELLLKELDEGVDRGKTTKRLALSWFRKAIDLDPQNHLYRNRLGFLLNDLGEFKESRQQFEEAVRINPEFAAGIRHLAIQLFSVFGQYDRAISLFRRAVAIDPTRFEPHELQYHCYWTLGDELEAYRWHKAGMGSGIGWDGGGLKDQAMYRVAHYQRHADHERYLGQLRIAVEKSSNWSSYRRLLLNEDMRDGRLNQALQRYKKLFPYLFEDEVVLDQQRLAAEGAGTMEPRNQALAAMELAEILLGLGHKERGNYLLDVGWEFFQRYPERTNWHWFYFYGYGIRDAVRFALRGEKKVALAAIREAVDGGFLDRLELESSVFDSLRDEPAFNAAMEIVEADWARQLANVRRMEANGELAPIPDDPRYKLATVAKIMVDH